MIPERTMRMLRDGHYEVAVTVLYQKGKVIGTVERIGYCQSVSQSTTDLVADAVELGADAVVFAHNHPGGTLEPSMEDIITAMQKRDVFEGHDIEVMGNWIVTAGGAVQY